MTELKESEKQITNLTKLQIKGKVGWEWNNIRRNDKELCWISLSLKLNNDAYHNNPAGQSFK